VGGQLGTVADASPAVFKTVCGALLRRPGWVRFPSIPATFRHKRFCKPFACGASSRLLNRAGHRHWQKGSDSAVVALFKLAHATSNTDGFAGAGMVASVSAIIWWTRLLPAPIAWFGALDAMYHGGLGLVVQLLLTGPIYGITGPISLLFSIPWILASVSPYWSSRLGHRARVTLFSPQPERERDTLRRWPYSTVR
jgi:hypothetical protein